MAGRRKKKRKKAKRKSSRNISFGNSLLRVFIGLAVLIFLVVFAALFTRHMLQRKQSLEPLPPIAKKVIKKKQPRKIPKFEVFPKEDKAPHTKRIIPKRIPVPGKLPRVAIIIDDLGYNREIAKKFIELDTEFTFSILPQSPYTKDIALAAREMGIEVMLHLPMEPIEYPRVNPGPGALLISMSPDQLVEQLKKNLDSIPSIKGVNNHMGSKMTQMSPQIYQIFTVLKQKNLFFIDSRSTTKTLCRPSARLFKIPFAERDVFIDHIQEPKFIKKQLRELVRIARKQGEAIGIAHPSKMTYEIIRKELPQLKKEVQFVPASSVVHPAG